MGVRVSARLQHTPGIRQWDPRTENWVPMCDSIWDPDSETGSHSCGGRYVEMGGVCLSVRRGTRTRACRRAQIAAPAFLGHNHRLSKKLNSPLSSIRLIIRTRGHPPTDPVN